MKSLVVPLLLSSVAILSVRGADTFTRCSLASPCSVQSLSIEDDLPTDQDYVVYTTSKASGER